MKMMNYQMWKKSFKKKNRIIEKKMEWNDNYNKNNEKIQ